MGTLESIHP